MAPPSLWTGCRASSTRWSTRAVNGIRAVAPLGGVDPPDVSPPRDHHRPGIRRPGERRKDAVNGPGFLLVVIETVEQGALRAAFQIAHEQNASSAHTPYEREEFCVG